MKDLGRNTLLFSIFAWSLVDLHGIIQHTRNSMDTPWNSVKFHRTRKPFFEDGNVMELMYIPP